MACAAVGPDSAVAAGGPRQIGVAQPSPEHFEGGPIVREGPMVWDRWDGRDKVPEQRSQAQPPRPPSDDRVDGATLMAGCGLPFDILTRVRSSAGAQHTHHQGKGREKQEAAQAP